MKNSVMALRMFMVCVLGLSLNIASGFLLAGDVVAQEKQLERKTKLTPALRAKVYDQLARSQHLADEGKISEAIEALNNVERKSASMNSYELAMMHNFYGFIYYNAEDYDNAISAFEKVVLQQPIPESFEKSTLYSLSQLHMMRGNYDKTVQFLERWESLNAGEVPAKNLVLKAQAMYQKKDYEAASRFINEAIVQQENSELGFQVDEKWYVLQRAVFYELKQPEKVTEVLVKLVKRFNKPEYWVQLSGMYGELGKEQEQLAILESAYQQGFITKGADIFTLAQLYYYHQAPIKAAKLMEKGIQEGKLEKNLRNLKFMSQSLSRAKENEKAIPVMFAAAEMSDDGELDLQLGQIFLKMEKYDEAIAASMRSMEKGGLSNPGTAHLVLGMAYFNERNFAESLQQLAKAEMHSKTKGMAQRWKKFVENEQEYANKIYAQTPLVGS